MNSSCISELSFNEFIKESDDAYKIFSKYCLKPDVKPKLLLQTNLSPYRYAGGRELKELGELLTVRYFIPPDPSRRLEENNAE